MIARAVLDPCFKQYPVRHDAELVYCSCRLLLTITIEYDSEENDGSHLFDNMCRIQTTEVTSGNSSYDRWRLLIIYMYTFSTVALL